MADFSVVVLTFNEEKSIERCLCSVRWADEIVVVDSFSSDNTVALAKQYTQKVFQFEYPGYSVQVERGIQQATGKWIFILDADEEVTPELASSIKAAIEQPDAHDGYMVARKVFVFGQWIKHGGWSPDWQFRLVRRDKYVAHHLEIHGGFTTQGSIGRLSGALNHYTYADIAQYLKKINDYTSLHVSNKLEDGSVDEARWYKIVFSPFLYFIRMFIIDKGYKDGMTGFFLAFYSALYNLALYAKLWEYRMRKQEGGGKLPPITNAALQRAKRF
jgi:glycosyltransferase involved in cell wall biosynthesis